MTQKIKNGNITFKIFDTQTVSDNSTENKKIYLFVPYSFKDNAKQKGARWDKSSGKWYTYENNPDSQYLIDLYHPDNFTHDFYGTHRKIRITTKEQRDKKCLAEKEEYEKLHKDWVEKNGSDEGFGLWYSVNVLNHE